MRRLCDDMQMYWFGPLLGGVLAGWLYDLLFAANATCQKTKAFISEKDYDDSQFDEDGRRGGSNTPGDAVNDHSYDKDQQDYGTIH